MWDTFILNPMINALLVLYDLLANNFVVAIAAFTLLIRLITLPLNLRQQRSAMRMQVMQPEVQRIQKKYRDNPQKMQEEFQKLGYNPAESLLGCLPLLIQFPILIGLYRAILVVMGSTPQALLELTQRVYSGIDLTRLLPVDNRFLWLNMAQPDPSIIVLPALVAGTTFLSQKLMTAKRNEPAKTPQQKQKEKEENPMAGMTQSMTYTMPLMFGFMALQFPAGLSIYFILSNIIGVGQSMLLRRSMPEAGAPRRPVVEAEDVEVEEEVAAEPAAPRPSSAAKKRNLPAGSQQKKKSQYKRRKR